MKVDTKEFELPDTVFIRDIDSSVFQSIILQCLSKIKGIRLAQGGFIDSFLGLENDDEIKGISVEQDLKNHSISVKVEVSIIYGLPIPEKSEEIQSLITEEMTKLTGLHVGSVHVVFKNVYTEDPHEKMAMKHSLKKTKSPENEYTDEF